MCKLQRVPAALRMDRKQLLVFTFLTFTQASTVPVVKLNTLFTGANTLSSKPSKFKALAGVVLAVITKLKVGLVQSLLGIFTVAVLIPVLVGVKVITKPVVPVVMDDNGVVVILNWVALVPVRKILLIFRVPPPGLEIEKVLDTLVPKSVLLPVLVPAPIGTLFPLPETTRLAVIDAGVIDPLITPPGLTQLEVVPVNAKLVSVPVLAPAASVAVL